MMDGERWNGRYAVANKDGIATLVAPKGLSQVCIKTGVAKHRRSHDSETEIGQGIHLIKIGRNMEGFTVIKPKFARLNVQLKLAPTLSNTVGVF